MEILKKIIIGTLVTIQSVTTIAQTDNTQQKVFTESYSLEFAKKYADAITVLTKNYQEKSYEQNLRLGWLYYLNKNYITSETYYQKATGLKPYSIEAKLGLIKPFAAVENWDKVLEQYMEILKIDPQHYTSNYWAGVINYNKKKYESASKYFEMIVNLYPFDYDANHMMAWSCLYQGRNNDAKMLFQKALLIKPGDASSLDGLEKIK